MATLYIFWIQRIRWLSYFCSSLSRILFCSREAYRTLCVCWIIACVESNDIAFHILVNIIVFCIVNETVRVGVHDLTFVAIHRWHVLVVKFVQADFRYVEYAHTHRLVELHHEFAHFDQIFRKDAAAMKIRFRDHCLRTVSSVPFCY